MAAPAALAAGALLALAAANVNREAYVAVARPLQPFVNDIGMAVFLALIGREIAAAAARGGALATGRSASIPLAAAAGGMLGSALVFLWLSAEIDRPDLERAWIIPSAADVVLGQPAARSIFGAVHPARRLASLVGLSAAVLSIVALAAFHPVANFKAAEFLALLGGAFAVSWGLRRAGVTRFWAYLACAGPLAWLAFHVGGLHPALALLPVVPFSMPPYTAQPSGPAGAADRSDEADPGGWLAAALLFVFGLANGGIVWTNAGAGTWLVLAALVVGRPAGLVSAVAVAAACGARLPAGVTWRDLAVIGILGAAGFGMALFFATAVFPYGRLLDEAKLAALASLALVPLAAAAAKLLAAGRFSEVR